MAKYFMVNGKTLKYLVYFPVRQAYGPFGSDEKDERKVYDNYLIALNIGFSSKAVVQAYFDGVTDALDDAKFVNYAAKRTRIQ